MKNPFRTFSEWKNRKWERVLARGRWITFLYCMLFGVGWSAYMITVMILLHYFKHNLNVEVLWDEAPIYMIGGFIMGFTVWTLNMYRSEALSKRKSKR